VEVGSRVDRRRALVSEPRHGELWWGDLPEGGRRPFLVLTRDAAIPLLPRLLCAPVTRTIRGIPSELRVDEDDGMLEESAVSFDNIQPIPKAAFTERIGQLSPVRMQHACRALRIAVDC